MPTYIPLIRTLRVAGRGRIANYSTMPFTYQEAVEKIISLQTNASVLEMLRKSGPRMNERSLPEMRGYLKRIGYEPRDFDKLNIIHVTGTKGKGSTCALTQSILRHYPVKEGEKPIRTGLFTSPHLIAMRERIRINGEPLSEEAFAKYSQQVWERLESTKVEALENLDTKDARELLRATREHPDKPTYFRYLTLLAFHVFLQEKVDVVVLEVGIGGEYDSTNVIEKPVVCGITALGLDHVSVLGETLDKIAWHKAGIMKPHVPAVAFEQPPEAMAVIEERSREKQAPLTVVRANQIDRLKDVEIGLAGIHQKYNALVAIELCRTWLKGCRNIDLTDAVPDGFREGLKRVIWPGRGQLLDIRDTKYSEKSKNVTWYLDGAHTTESLQVCADWFRENALQQQTKVSRVLVFNCTNGRDGPKLLNVIGKIHPEVKFDHVIFTTNVTFRKGYTADTANKTVSVEDAVAMQNSLAESWKARIPNFAPDNVHVVPTIEDALDWIVSYAQSRSEQVQVLTTGSLIMVGNTLTALGIPPK